MKCPKNYKTSKLDEANYEKNQKILAYLDNNLEISTLSGFEIIKNMKIMDLMANYFISKEFEDTLILLKEKENEGQDYIQLYIYKCKNYIEYYSKNPEEKEGHQIDSDEECSEEDPYDDLNSNNINDYFNFEG